MKELSGLQRICKMYGRINCSDANGNKVVWLWDYANDKPRLQSEMTKQEIAASEKAKWQIVKKQIDSEKKVNHEF